ncbi:hypothetical protein Ddye_013257 [Dipteronia dyeriana]|uniref:PGG domain-containing protein n=1 Tax=Dipteronia dyeriana TaxID=168575 RepID=A0AAD9X5S4_9ROSI|nr:hypothetical protein Ddye_013257 [Dipteronia dyeriana]
MSISGDSLPSLSSLSDAIKGDDIGSLKSILSTKPEILEVAAQIWPEDPFILAYKSKSLHVIKEIGTRKPEFARMKNQDGNTILHLACASGDDEMVRVLVRIDSKLCKVRNNLSMTPLHTAVKHGQGDVVRELISACPKSLGILTSQLETAFHVAVKNNKCDALKVLLEEAEKIGKKYLLKKKDDQGDSVLHVAVSNELVLILKMLVVYYPRSRTRLLELVNSPNKKGHTALDLCNMSNSSVSADWIRPILIELGAIESNTLRKSKSSTSSMWLTEKRDVLLVILAIFIGVVFTVSSALPTYFPKDKINLSEPFQFEAVASGRLPLVFYFLVCLTVTLTISACFLTVLLYKLPLGYLLFLSGIAIFFLYILLANYIMPEFFIKLGSHHISSYRLMWILALTYIFAGTLLLLVGKYLLFCFNKFAYWPMRRLQDSNFLSTSAKAVTFVEEFRRGNEKLVDETGSPTTARGSPLIVTPLPLWQPSSPGFYKVNLDAALDTANGLVGIGIIAHNSQGQVVGSSSS